MCYTACIYVLYRRRQNVETQNLASHSYVSPIFIDGDMLMEIGSVACETQDFASLQGWRHCNVMMRMYVL